jgi:hypothetical protein
MRAHLQQKAVELSNAVKQALGLPLVLLPEAPIPKPGFVHIMPIGPPTFVSTKPIPEVHDRVVPIPIFVSNEPIPEDCHNTYPPQVKRPKCFTKTIPFFQRVHAALITLGPWEGKAVAFVLGCGIGVLLRMVWILAVVSYRMIRGTNENEIGYTEIVFVEEINESEVSAPAYTASDDKGVCKADTKC